MMEPDAIANKQSQNELAERKKAEALLNGQNRVLELVATGAPLPESLTALVRLIEEHAPGMLGSILLLDEEGVHLRHGAAPSLPPEYAAAIDGVVIGPNVGSCGTAAYCRKAVVVEDIATDPLWNEYKAVALSHGLHACWSTPIFDAERRVLGTFAMYYRQPALPQPDHLRLIDIATHTAAIVIGHHRIEVALRESEAKYRRIVDTATEGIWVLGPDTMTTFVNARMAEMLGCSGEEMNGRPLTDFIFEEDAPDHLRKMENRRQGVSENYQRRFRRKDGQTVWTLAAATPIFDDEHRFNGSFAMLTDITERKQAEEEIRTLNATLEMRVHQRTRELSESEARFRTIYDTSPVSIWQEDWTQVIQGIEELRAQGVGDFAAYFREHPEFVARALNEVKILDVNQWTLGMFAAGNKADILASLGTVFSSADTLPGFIGELNALAQGQTVYRTEMALNTVKGDMVHGLLAMAFPPPDSHSGEVLVSVIDITERKRAEEAIRTLNATLEERVLERTAQLNKAIATLNSEISERKRTEESLWESSQMLKLVLDNMPAFVFWKDRNSVYLGCNYLFAANAGLSPQEEIIGMTDLDLPWKYTEAESYRADDRRVMETGIPKLNYEETQHTADGRVTWVRTSKIPLRNPEGDVIGVLGTFEDITERMRAEEELNRLNEELELRVKERTAELAAKNAELERMNRLFVGRELRMVELKEKIAELEKKVQERNGVN
jgi:PAS domain S-box-containing protein